MNEMRSRWKEPPPVCEVRRCWKVPVVWCGRDRRMHEDWVCRDGTREEALASVAHTMTADPGVTWWVFNFKRKEA